MDGLTWLTVGGRARRWWPGLLVAVGVGAWVLRALPFFHRAGALGYVVNYDEGVYAAASALLWKGLLPYRDFLFVHPPGALLLGAPAAAVGAFGDPATGFALARWLATAMGAVSTVLVGRLAMRAWGPVAGVVAALAYAMHPEVVTMERGPFLDPLLNLCGLGLANVWLLPSGRAPLPRRAGLAGVLAGVMASVKVLGGIWGAAALVARAPELRWSLARRFVLAASFTVLALVGPLALMAPGAFVRDVLWFQSARPEDGVTSRSERLLEMTHERRRYALLLAAVGLCVALARAVRRGTRAQAAPERFVATAYLLTVAAYLAAHSYWSNYNALLAGPEALLAGLGAAALVGLASARARPAGAVAFGLVLLAPLHSLREALRGSEIRPPEQVLLARYVREQVPPDASLCGFEPGWGLLAGRLPPRLPGQAVPLDTYALMLQDAVASGTRFPDAAAAFASADSQTRMLALLARCDFVLLGARGQWQLSTGSRRWFQANYSRGVSPDSPAVELWRRHELTSASATGASP
ncbi:glycosyltransferase family 39 protein [Corallococcus sp. AB049A]|uniref:glycosyltransferase family 39 protein n=1 Tax=Corallococcus sp. AB049A TaxID=2316721 RepID=UPI0011C418EE|nr:glycosyltransferase family 39 protein [Corallococcus sp. AB049A]